jgi:methylated-DNA-[protein]-cysteine S-methyltransferase
MFSRMATATREAPTKSTVFLHDRLSSPIGVLLVVIDDQERLRALDWEDYEARMRRLLRLHYGGQVELVNGVTPARVRAALTAYFEGSLAGIDDLQVETGGTPFQRSVWSALRTIRAGDTWSYRKLAERIGAPKAVRAVGLANGANPVGVVVPCHRVIGADGSLTGYGGGLDRKRWLLAHESRTARESS